MQEIIDNATKRKQEEVKKEQEEREIASKEQRISELNEKLKEKENEFGQKTQELSQYQIFSDFLEKVVNDSEEQENREFENIEALKSRFFNLRNENAKLMDRKD